MLKSLGSHTVIKLGVFHYVFCVYVVVGRLVYPWSYLAAALLTLGLNPKSFTQCVSLSILSSIGGEKNSGSFSYAVGQLNRVL